MTLEIDSDALRRLVANAPGLMRCLRSVRDSIDAPQESRQPSARAASSNAAPGLPAAPTSRRVSWCIGAGAVRSLVWDHLHGFPASTPTDVDVAYFDPSRVTSEATLKATLAARHPDVRWDIVNQAFVHEWSAPCPVVRPLTSLEDGLASWPETATAVGVYLDHTGKIGIVAPYGLDDLFDLVLRRSPGVHRPEAFDERLASKLFRERWPLLHLLGH